MASLKLEHIYKVYPNGTKAVNDFSLDIENGEFIVFVGPSGCGKSTTLRMIAGLEDITAGELYIDDDIVNDREPKDRDIAMVFQNYALYPHMTVYENMAFGLKLHHVPDDIIQEKVLWASEILGIKEYLDRKPRNMSGGQRQRVALGRAILRDPKVMLLDEPLSNLDAKLRAQMRTEIAKLHQKLKTTFIYVTHDQTEAMTLGDRVVVMKNGRIQQVDTPKNLYNYPANKFVAGFIGTPQMNFLDCTLKREGDIVKLHLLLNDQTLEISYNHLIKALPAYLNGDRKLTLGVRCENLSLTSEETKDAIRVKVSHFEELGNECLIYATLKDEENVDSDEGQLIIRVKSVEGLKENSTLYIKMDYDHIYFFDSESENTIMPRIPDYNSFTVSIKNNKIALLNQTYTLPNALYLGELSEAELQVPTSSIKLNEGTLRAEVVDVEKINDIYLIHLESAGRVFFAQSKREYERGKEVNFALDSTTLTLKKDDKVLFNPIEAYDELYASFLNYQTALDENADFAYSNYRQERIEKANAEKERLLAEEEKRYQLAKEDIEKRDIQAEAQLAKSQLEELTSRNNAEIAKVRQDGKEEMRKLTSDFKAAKKKAKAENDKLFQEKKEKEIADFKAFKEHNTDKNALKRRTDEYHIFKDNFQTDKENTLNLAWNTLTMDYESKASALKASTRRKIDLLKKEIKEKGKEIAAKERPLEVLEKEHNANVKRLTKLGDSLIKNAGFVFFFAFPSDYLALSTDTISNKLIQGLGTRVFTKEFKVSMPHDGYRIEERGLPVTVDGNLDYGDVYFVRLAYLDKTGEQKYIFLKNKEPLEVGKQLHVQFDLENCQITETDMNIRLY